VEGESVHTLNLSKTDVPAYSLCVSILGDCAMPSIKCHLNVLSAIPL
jgi:hypothetical protein